MSDRGSFCYIPSALVPMLRDDLLKLLEKYQVQLDPDHRGDCLVGLYEVSSQAKVILAGLNGYIYAQTNRACSCKVVRLLPRNDSTGE